MAERAVAPQAERVARAKQQGLPPEAVPTAEGLTVRVINNVTKQMEVKPNFYEAFKDSGYPAQFPYRQKVGYCLLGGWPRVGTPGLSAGWRRRRARRARRSRSLPLPNGKPIFLRKVTASARASWRSQRIFFWGVGWC
jgi:hypothetical protein